MGSRCRDGEKQSEGLFTDGSHSCGPAEAEPRLTLVCEYVGTYLGPRHEDKLTQRPKTQDTREASLPSLMKVRRSQEQVSIFSLRGRPKTGSQLPAVAPVSAFLPGKGWRQWHLSGGSRRDNMQMTALTTDHSHTYSKSSQPHLLLCGQCTDGKLEAQTLL